MAKNMCCVCAELMRKPYQEIHDYIGVLDKPVHCENCDNVYHVTYDVSKEEYDFSYINKLRNLKEIEYLELGLDYVNVPMLLALLNRKGCVHCERLGIRSFDYSRKVTKDVDMDIYCPSCANVYKLYESHCDGIYLAEYKGNVKKGAKLQINHVIVSDFLQNYN